jgi:hypothetical protein
MDIRDLTYIFSNDARLRTEFSSRVTIRMVKVKIMVFMRMFIAMLYLSEKSSSF